MAGGRKLEFDKEQALEAAMHVFWKKGFVGASLSDLTEGMGINKPSMYAAFGNKESLFIQATNHYLEKYAKSPSQALYQADTPLQNRLKAYLMSVVAGQCDTDSPRGCFISLCVTEAAGETIPEGALKTVTDAGQYAINTLTEFFEKDDEARQRRLDSNAEEKALFLVTTLNGTAALARAGKGLAELEPVIDLALKALEL